MQLNDRQALSLLRTRINSALSALGTELGITLNAGNCSYSPDGNTCSFKLNVGVIQANGVAASKESEDFKRFAKLNGFEPTDLGKTFVSQGMTFEISGYAPRSYKRPILAKSRNDGRTYKFTSAGVLRLLGKPVPAHVM